MRRLAPLLLLILAVSCAMPTDGKDGRDAAAPNRWLVDSAWNTLDYAYFGPGGLTSMSAWEARRDAWNSGHSDDQWQIIEGDLPPVAKAPPAPVAVIEGEYNQRVSVATVARPEVAAKRAELRASLKAGQTLYIDRDPPPALHIPTEYEKWALYYISKGGKILYEEHCPTEAIFRERRALYYQQVAADANGNFVVEGRLYVEPAGAY